MARKVSTQVAARNSALTVANTYLAIRNDALSAMMADAAIFAFCHASHAVSDAADIAANEDEDGEMGWLTGLLSERSDVTTDRAAVRDDARPFAMASAAVAVEAVDTYRSALEVLNAAQARINADRKARYLAYVLPNRGDGYGHE